MRERVNKRVDELIRRAKNGRSRPSAGIKRRSSLDKVIRTKEQAEKFLRLLQD